MAHKVISTTSVEYVYVLVTDMTVIKNNLGEVADYINANPTATKWLHLPSITITGIEEV